MEEKRDSEADLSGESTVVASGSLDDPPIPVAPPIASAVNGDLGYNQPAVESITGIEANQEVSGEKLLGGNTANGSDVKVHQHETFVLDSELSAEPTIPDVSLSNDTLTVENLNTNVEQEDVVDDSNTLAQNGTPYALDQNGFTTKEATNVLEETSAVVSPVVNPLGSAVVLEALPKEVEEIPTVGNSPSIEVVAAAAAAATMESSGPHSHGSVDVLEPSRKDVAKISQRGDVSSVRTLGDAVHNDFSATANVTKTEVKSSLTLAELKNQKNAGLAKEKRSTSAKSEKQEKQVIANRGVVDTAAPFESVKEAVTKFGGIVDWKAHKAQALEKRKLVLSELEKVQKEIPEYKKQSEAAEKAKAELLKELDDTKKIIEELKVKLERAETEEAQAKQDSELAQLRVKEMEQGIVEESSIAVKTQQEVAKTRHEAATAELKLVKEELKVLQEKYVSLVSERDVSVRKADEAISVSKEMEKTVEDLTVELIAIKESVELAQNAHMEVEEHRMGAFLASDQDLLAWQEDLKQANEEVQRLTQQLSLTKDVKAQLDTASTLLATLKAELEAYMEAKLKQESSNIVEEKPANDIERRTENQGSLQQLVSTRKELERVKAMIEKAKEEVDCLKIAASSLKSELDKEKGSLTNLRQREGMASIAVSSLEADLERTKQELEVVRLKEKEAREKMNELPKLLQRAAQEADEAKSAAQAAQEELRNAKELAEQVKASTSTTEIRLQAALKEIEAAKASEKLALSAIKALEESENADGDTEDSPSGVTLPLSEYFDLSKKAHDAEQLAHETVTAALAQIQEAKQSEMKCLQSLEEGYKELNNRKEALRVAKEKAEKAIEGKLGAEQELRKWRAENEQRRKSSDAAKAAINPMSSPQRSFMQNSNIKSFNKQETDVFIHPVHDTSSYTSEESSPGNDVSGDKIRRKKRSFFPRILLYIARKTRQQRSSGRS